QSRRACGEGGFREDPGAGSQESDRAAGLREGAGEARPRRVSAAVSKGPGNEQRLRCDRTEAPSRGGGEANQRNDRAAGGKRNEARSLMRYTLTDSGISALCATLCTSSLSSSVSMSRSSFCVCSSLNGTVLLGMLVISPASTGTLAVSMASLTLR